MNPDFPRGDRTYYVSDERLRAFRQLTPEQKYFFLYLLTNEKTSQCGIYEITKRHICYDTWYNIDTVSKLLNFFIEAGKIKYNYDTSEVAIKNWLMR